MLCSSVGTCDASNCEQSAACTDSCSGLHNAHGWLFYCVIVQGQLPAAPAPAPAPEPGKQEEPKSSFQAFGGKSYSLKG